jgi:hypothetical protein
MNELSASRTHTVANATAGRTGMFDVAGWIDQAQQAGKKPTAIIYADGSRGLGISEGYTVGGPYLADVPDAKRASVIDTLVRQGAVWRSPDTPSRIYSALGF